LLKIKAKMAASTVSTIYINGKEAENSLKGLTAHATRLAAELKRAELGSDDFAKKAEEWRKVKAIIDDQKASLKEYIDTYGKTAPADKSITRLREKHHELVKELDLLEVGTKEWLAQLAKVKESETGLNKINAQIKGAEKTTEGFGGALGKVGGLMAGAFAVDTVIGYVDELRKTAVMLDTYNKKTQIVFAESAHIVEESATKQSADIGLARSQYKLLATDIGDLLVPMGFQREEAARVSVQLVDLSGALAEWSGGQKTATEVSGSLRKALMGEYEELESVGVKLSEDIVKSKLAAQGKDKLTGAALEQAKAQAVLALIMEKSQDAQTAFAQNQDSLARQSARLSASFQTIKETLAASLIPLFEKMTAGVVSVIAPQKTRVDLLQDEQMKMNVLAEALKSDNVTRETKKKILNDFNVIMKNNHLPNLLTEKSAINDIEAAQNAANAAFLKKIQLVAVEEDLKDKSKEFLKIKQAEYDLQVKLAEAKLNKDDTNAVGINGVVTIKDGSNLKKMLEDSVNENLSAQKRVQDEMNKTMQIAAQMGIDINKVLNPGGGTGKTGGGGGAPDKDAQKEAEKAGEALKRLSEQIKAFRNDASQSAQEGVALEISKINEKYDKELQAITDFAKKFPSKHKEAHQLEIELRGYHNQELKNLYNHHFQELETGLEKHLEEFNLKHIDADEREYQQIFEKYDKEIKAAKDLEKNFSTATEAERAKAHRLRLALEETRDNEINEARALRAAEQLLKDVEGNVRFQEEMKKLKEGYEALMKETNVKPISLFATDEEELRLQKQKFDEQAQQEIIQLNAKYDKEVEAQKGYDERIIDLNKKREANVKQILQNASSEKDKLDKDFLSKSIQNYQKLAGAIGDAFSALGDIIGNETKEAAALQKVAALAKIAIDTAQAISGVIAAAASTSITPIDLAIKIASGTAVVLANIANAKRLIEGAPKVQQKFMGGYHSVQGATDGQTYRAQYIGQPQTGMLPSVPSLVLASERGAEYFVSNEALSRADVAWHVRAIDNLMRYSPRAVPQFQEGGYTMPQAITPSPQNDTVLLNNTLHLLIKVLEGGIEAKTVIGYRETRDLRDAINRINTIEG
jgi:hypothetical protein